MLLLGSGGAEDWARQVAWSERRGVNPVLSRDGIEYMQFNLHFVNTHLLLGVDPEQIESGPQGMRKAMVKLLILSFI